MERHRERDRQTDLHGCAAAAAGVWPVLLVLLV